MKTIDEVASSVGFRPGDLIPAGRGALKVPVALIRSLSQGSRRGHLVLVSAMTATEHGEGKTVVSIGLAMALERLGHHSVVCLRQPSIGPVFGSKGGATGGGRSTVEPRSVIDLGLTGDLDAIANAQNLLAALVDHHIFRGNSLGLAADVPVLPRASSIEDRSLRDITTGLSAPAPGFPRKGQFVVTAATEVAAIHALAGDYADLKRRLGRIVVGRNGSGAPVRASDLAAEGSVSTLLATALAPNLVQTTEGTAAFVHGIPYANVAHGTCSLLSMQAGISLSEYCVVEAGFATELGAEKFVDIVSRQSHLDANVGVVVATVRALRHHGGGAEGAISPEAVERGLANLDQHLGNMRRIGLDPIVALNRFPTDSPEEIGRVERFCAERGAPCAITTMFQDGGAGAENLARFVIEAAARGQKSHPVYPANAPVEEVLARVVTEFYGGAAVELSPEAAADLEAIRSMGEANGPVCIAKTPRSLSDDARKVGRPTGFTVRVRRLMRWSGAGFTVAIVGSIVTLPGLPEHPATETIGLSDEGEVVGLR
jgi:formate--tetrahydrofolate ligase